MRFAALVISIGVATTACATRSSYRVGGDGMLYVIGAGEALKQRVVVRLDTTSDSAFRLDAGSGGSLTIPYAAISALRYGPLQSGRLSDEERPAWRFPWSGRLSGGWAKLPSDAPHFLKIFHHDNVHGVTLRLGDDVVRPTLEMLEVRSGHAIRFETPVACTRYKTDCRYGDPADLEGRTTVYIDTSESYDRRAAHYARFPGFRETLVEAPHDRIVAALTEAQVGLKIVARREDAEILLAFRGLNWTSDKPTCVAGRGNYLDRASGEVYVSHPTGLQAVMLFDEACSIRRRWLATTFAERFIQAYRRANDMKER